MIPNYLTKFLLIILIGLIVNCQIVQNIKEKKVDIQHSVVREKTSNIVKKKENLQNTETKSPIVEPVITKKNEIESKSNEKVKIELKNSPIQKKSVKNQPSKVYPIIRILIFPTISIQKNDESGLLIQYISKLAISNIPYISVVHSDPIQIYLESKYLQKKTNSEFELTKNIQIILESQNADYGFVGEIKENQIIGRLVSQNNSISNKIQYSVSRLEEIKSISFLQKWTKELKQLSIWKERTIDLTEYNLRFSIQTMLNLSKAEAETSIYEEDNLYNAIQYYKKAAESDLNLTEINAKLCEARMRYLYTKYSLKKKFTDFEYNDRYEYEFQAKSECSKSLESNPNSSESTRAMSYFYFVQSQWIDNYQKNDDKFRALFYAKRSLSINQMDNEMAWLIHTLSIDEDNKYKIDTTSSEYKNAVRLSNPTFENYIHKARMLSTNRSKLNFSIELYQKLIQATPNNIQSRIELARVYRNNEMYNQSINVLKKASSFFPNNYQINLSLAEHHKDTKQNKQAEFFYKKILKDSPKNFIKAIPTIYTFYTDYIHYTGKIIPLLKDAIQVDPKNEHKYLDYLGMIYIHKREYTKAVSKLKKSKELKEGLSHLTEADLADNHLNMGIAYIGQKRYSLAIHSLDTASVNYQKVFGENYFYLSYVYGQLAIANEMTYSFDVAISYYIKSLKIKEIHLGREHPELALIYNNLGIAYSRKGAFRKSIENFNQCLYILVKRYDSTHPYSDRAFQNLKRSLFTKELIQYAILLLENDSKLDSVHSNWYLSKISEIEKELTYR